MKKLLLLLALSLLLTGCGASADPTEGEMTDPSQPAAEEYGTRLGQKLQNFAVTTVEGEELILSDILTEKKLVVLNFWFVDCTWCQREFPALELAYQRYKENVEVLALTPYDTKASASEFAEDHSLSFPVATCAESFPQAFGVNGYPTSVFVDREGRVSLIHSGAITNADVFYAAFDAYIAEDYTHGIYYNISELVS